MKSTQREGRLLLAGVLGKKRECSKRMGFTGEGLTRNKNRPSDGSKRKTIRAMQII